MKATRSLIALTFVFSSTIFAENFGTISKNIQHKWEETRINDLVAQSSDVRSDINKRRSIAGNTQHETQLANDFTTLMNSDDDKDYLELSLKL